MQDIIRNKIAYGDSHSIMVMRNILKDVYNSEIYFVGDGGNYDIQKQGIEIKTLNLSLKKNNNFLFLLRGNHDSPEFWANGGLKRSNLWYVPDYTVVNNTLFIGGAVSIDRMYRIANNLPYWTDEVLKFQDVSHLRNIETVITHTAPNFCPPLGINSFVQSFINFEERNGIHFLKAQIIEERETLTNIYKTLSENNNIKNYFFGHFHGSSYFYHNNTSFIGLAENELKVF